MRNILLTLLLISRTALALGQDTGKIYYTKDWQPTSPDNAAYYQNWEKAGDHYEVHDYYMNGVLLSSGLITSPYESFQKQRDGHFTYFDTASGLKASEGDYKNGLKNGSWFEYGHGSNLTAFETVYKADTIIRKKGFGKNGMAVSFVSEFEFGKKVHQTFYHENGVKKSEADYTDDVVLVKKKCFGITGDDTTCPLPPKNGYLFVERMPAPGYSMNDYLNANIHYPQSARRAGKEGRVVVHFVIMEDGVSAM